MLQLEIDLDCIFFIRFHLPITGCIDGTENIIVCVYIEIGFFFVWTNQRILILFTPFLHLQRNETFVSDH